MFASRVCLRGLAVLACLRVDASVCLWVVCETKSTAESYAPLFLSFLRQGSRFVPTKVFVSSPPQLNPHQLDSRAHPRNGGYIGFHLGTRLVSHSSTANHRNSNVSLCDSLPPRCLSLQLCSDKKSVGLAYVHASKRNRRKSIGIRTEAELCKRIAHHEGSL